MKVLTIYITSIILSLNCYSQEQNIGNYFPLKTGNTWVYSWIYMGYPVTGGISKCVITNDTVINSKKYYEYPLPDIGLHYLRFDTVSGNIYVYNPAGGCGYHLGETLIDSLRSKLNDTASFCDSIYRKCIDTGFAALFGSQYKKKDFLPINALTASSKHYAKNIGPYFLNSGDPYTTIYNLIGCVINGVVYGDTSVPSGITSTGHIIPGSFSLSQNYPNPFNPVTKIKFAIPLLRGLSEGRGVSVRLILYDVLGREIITLVNEQLQPGTYEAEWDASNYPSGVYFYKLTTQDFSKTKKMVLIK